MSGDPFSLLIEFVDHSDAGSATFINVGDSPGLVAAGVSFNESSSAAESTIINEEGDTAGGGTVFWDSATAGNSTITTYLNATNTFFNSATAGNATLIADGGLVRFEYTSTGGMARVELLDVGTLDLSATDKSGPMTIGSLEGDSSRPSVRKRARIPPRVIHELPEKLSRDIPALHAPRRS